MRPCASLLGLGRTLSRGPILYEVQPISRHCSALLHQSNALLQISGTSRITSDYFPPRSFSLTGSRRFSTRHDEPKTAPHASPQREEPPPTPPPPPTPSPTRHASPKPLSQQSLRELRSSFVDEPTKEWVSRFTSHLQPGANWVREQFFNRILRYTEKLEKRFENLTPETYKKYKSLSNGFKLLVQDIVKVAEMATELHYKPHYHLYKRKDLEAYLELPKDIKRVTPLLCIFPVPGGALICLPLASYFPRQFLSRHFWTEDQRQEFSLIAHKKRISYYRTLLRKLKRCVLRKAAPGETRDAVIALVEDVEKGGTPTLEQLLSVEKFFLSYPLDLEYFSRSHKRALLKANDIRWVLPGFYQRNLYFEGQMLRAIDDVMKMEGISKLSDSELSFVLFARGFSPVGLEREQQLRHIEEWVDVTTKLDPRAIALYLHLPALLFLNNKNLKEIEDVDIPDDE